MTSLSCTCTHVSCYGMRSSLALAPSCTHISCSVRSSLALAPTFYATLWDLLLHLHHLAPTFHVTLWDLLLHLHPRFMLRYEILSCTCTILHPRFMLRYEIFSCTCPHVSCYAMRSSLALALGTRDPKDRRVAKHLFDTVKSFMFRHNCGCQLWSQLGKLAEKERLK